MGNIIEARDVYFSYKNDFEENIIPESVLNGINIDVKLGEFVAILGHNGSGKSTIAKHFNSILLPESGTIIVDGMDTKNEEMLLTIRQTVGMVFQNPDNQIVATIVEEDVAFGPENLGVEPSEIRVRVDEALQTVNMYEYREHAPHRLSGGQKQRVAIAGVIAMKPRCIVFDEPTAMLDPQGRRDVLETIKELNRIEGITIVLITHYMDEAAQADRVIVMDKGKVIMEDVPKKVFSQVEKLKKVGLDVPQVTEFCHELILDGFDIDREIITEDECVNAILDLFNSEK